MFRLLFWALLIGGGVLVANGTVPVPGVADEEVVYATPPAVTTCGSSGCIVVYALELANVGRSPQDTVRVRLRSEVLAAPVIAPTVRRAGETTLATAANERPGIDIYEVGAMAPEERVVVVFAGRATSRDAALRWDRVLVGVEPARGVATPGDPAAVTPTRLIHAAGRLVRHVVDAITAS
jgi:hypothetical protein